MVTNWSAPGYSEIRSLGSGASGRVALARKDETDDLVVITYLSAELVSDAANAERIRREAALLAGMRHPNIAHIDEVLDSPDGEDMALVMAAVESRTLRAMLSLRRLLPEAALATVRCALLGMAAAHERGVVLRDHNPDNVLVDAAGQCKLINIGIAAPTGEAGPLLGAPPYLAPELWDGAPASPASDVYAAAVTLFECLTGAQPFRGSTAELRSLHRDAPVPLDQVPDPVRGLAARGMAKDPQQRYPNAQAFIDDLDATADAAHGPGWLERGLQALAEAAEVMISAPDGSAASPTGAGEPWWQSRRARFAGVAAVVVLALLAVLLFLIDGSSTENVVRKPFDQALAALAKSPGVRYQDRHVNFEYFDVTMTATGEKFGSVGSTPDASGKSDEAFVTAGGRDYMSFKNDPVTRGWRYDPGDDEKNAGPALKDYLAPAQLAAKLTKALEQQPRLPVVGDRTAASVKVHGTPAWKADTVDGFIFVTRKAPYRLLRWEPPGVNTLPKITSTSRLPRSVEARTPLSDSRGMDVTPITDADRLYATVVKNTRELADATADSVQILQQNGGASGVRCSSSGCHVHVAFSGPVYNATSTKYSLTTVYIELTVGSITTGTIEVGGCASGHRPYRLTGRTLDGTLTCDNPRAGATYDSVDAQNQRKANAAGNSSFWDVASDINLRVYPLSSADIDKLVATQERELKSLG
ncbi:serine/threonine-protein kinase [Streptomyces sp. NPDC002513]